MITAKKTILKPIFESSKGIHLSIYLKNRGELRDIFHQLQQTLEEAYEWLHDIQNTEERRKFFEPLDMLFKNPCVLENIKGNIGIFRTKSWFRILSIPVELEKQCHVAESFHIKPLLRWMQLDREFLILGFNYESAHLYFGNQNSFHKIDSIFFPELLKQNHYFGQTEKQFYNSQKHSFIWLNEWIRETTKHAAPRLYLAGNPVLEKVVRDSLDYRNLAPFAIAKDFNANNVNNICAKLRRNLNHQANQDFLNNIDEFRFAAENNLTNDNIFQIAKEATKGRIKKLLIADDINVFGKLDQKTGDLVIHPFDLNHEDDDLLDDLAQTVMASGGEVIIAPWGDIPKGRPILAMQNRPTQIYCKDQNANPYLESLR